MKRLTLVLALVVSLSAHAIPSYWMWIFAFQDSFLNLPKYSHSWALFVEIDDNDVTDHVVINWLAKDKNFGIFQATEPGENFPIQLAFDFVTENDFRWRKFGPFEIRKELYDRALKRVTTDLNGKSFKYKCWPSNGERLLGATNCIHSISDIDHDNGLLYTGTARGIKASRMLVDHFEARWILGDKEPPGLSKLVAKKLSLPPPFF